MIDVHIPTFILLDIFRLDNMFYCDCYSNDCLIFTLYQG